MHGKCRDCDSEHIKGPKKKGFALCWTKPLNNDEQLDPRNCSQVVVLDTRVL
jgi:hypothetical protein